MLPSRRGLTLCCLFVAADALSASQTIAATATTTFQVQIVITNSCSIDSATNMDFGSHGSLSLGASAISTVNVQCTLLVPYSISLDAGTGAGATTSARKLTGPGGATINYSLFQDVTHLLAWGTGIGIDTVSGVGTGLSVPHIIYGLVSPQATPTAGTFSDTVTITINY